MRAWAKRRQHERPPDDLPRRWTPEEADEKRWNALQGTDELRRVGKDDDRIARLMLRQGITPSAAAYYLRRIEDTASSPHDEVWCYRFVVLPAVKARSEFSKHLDDLGPYAGMKVDAGVRLFSIDERLPGAFDKSAIAAALDAENGHAKRNVTVFKDQQRLIPPYFYVLPEGRCVSPWWRDDVQERLAAARGAKGTWLPIMLAFIIDFHVRALALEPAHLSARIFEERLGVQRTTAAQYAHVFEAEYSDVLTVSLRRPHPVLRRANTYEVRQEAWGAAPC